MWRKGNLIFYLLFFFGGLTGSQLLWSQEEIPVLESEVRFAEHKFLPGYNLKKLGNPHFFQGNSKKKKYFEGWYFKMVSPGGSSILSVIPGISLSEDGEHQHAFIQLIDGNSTETEYITFPIEEFYFSKKEFAVRIGENYFSENKIILNIKSDSIRAKGEVDMYRQVKLSPRNNKNGNIMGWYRFVPFMECYHGVVSLSHALDGQMEIDGKSYIFNRGRGYIEKDWGKSMPSAWIWTQTNSFQGKDGSFMLSIANIPWLGNSFTGFLGFFLQDGEVHRFATYTAAELQLEIIDPSSLKISIQDKKMNYHIETYRKNSGILKAPVRGAMDRRIAESIDATLKLTVTDKEGNKIFLDSTSIAGLEIVGETASLLKKVK